MKISLSGEFLEDTDIPVIWERDDDDPQFFVLKQLFKGNMARKGAAVNSTQSSGTVVIQFKHPGTVTLVALDQQNNQIGRSSEITVVASTPTSSVFSTFATSIPPSLPSTNATLTAGASLDVSNSRNSHIPVIVGGIVAAVVSLTIIGVLIYLWRRRRRQKAPSARFRDMVAHRPSDTPFFRGPSSVISQASFAGLLQHGSNNSVASFNTRTPFHNPFSFSGRTRDSLVTPFHISPGSDQLSPSQSIAPVPTRQSALQERIQNWQASMRQGGADA